MPGAATHLDLAGRALHARFSTGPEPRSDVVREEHPIRRSGEIGLSAGTRPARVVIADDNDGIRTLLRTLISLEDDLEVVGEAADGREALELVLDRGPDVVVLDLAMPEMDGLQVLEELRARGADTPVLVYSGFASPGVEEAARRHGAVDFVLKGTDPDALIQRLRAVSA